MTIFEGTIVWSGFTGAPGYTNLHWTNAGIKQTAINNGVTGMKQFTTDLSAALPSGVTLTVQGEVKEFDPATGALLSLNSPSVAPTPTGGGGGGSIGPAPAGACISWSTGGVNRGRRVRGRTFIVPLTMGMFQPDGTLEAGALSIFNTAASNWRTSSAYESLIWSRPRAGAGGAAFPITGHNVRDRVAVLRSRRQ